MYINAHSFIMFMRYKMHFDVSHAIGIIGLHFCFYTYIYEIYIISTQLPASIESVDVTFLLDVTKI